MPTRATAWGVPAAENSCRPPLRVADVCRPIALLKAAGMVPFRQGRIAANRCDRQVRERASQSSSRPGRPVRQAQKAGHIFRAKLEAQGRAKMIDAKAAEVFVEIPQHRRQRERLDPCRLRPFGQCRAGVSTGALSSPVGSSQVRCAPVMSPLRSVTAAISAGQISVGASASGR